MSLVTPYIEHLKFIENNLENIARDIVMQNADFIISLLVDRQIHLGINSEGRSMGTYSSKTQEYADDPDRRRDGLPRYFSDEDMPKTGRYNLDWYGDYIENIFLIEGVGGFDIWSKDHKAAIIQEKYGKGGKVLKLTKEHNDFINMELIMPGLQKYLLHNLMRVGMPLQTIDFMQERSSSFDY